MRTLLLISFSACAINLFGQVNLAKRITLEVKEIHLVELFEILDSKHGITIAYGTYNVPSTLRITISAKNKTVYEIIMMICSQTGLSYELIDNTILLKYTRPVQLRRSVNVIESIPPSYKKDSTLALSLKTFTHGSDSVVMRKLDSLKASTLQELKGSKLIQLETTVKQPIHLDPVPVPSLFSPRKKQSQIGFYGAGVFISYAVDFNRFHFVERNMMFQKYTTDWNNSFSLGGYIILSSKFYISVGAGYATKDFALNYNYKILDQSDPIPIPDQTRVEIRYLEVPLTIGYRILSRKKYSLFIATGFYPSYLIEKSEKTSYLNKGNPDTEFFLKANRSTLYSGTLGFIAHYSLSKRFGIFLEPGYLYFIGPVNREAMHSNSALYRVKTGIQFSLYHKK